MIYCSVSYDKLLVIMYDLGFPVDCIEAVKNLYQVTGTPFLLPCGETGSGKVKRGTIPRKQPLTSLPHLHKTTCALVSLRRLHSGARGYRSTSLRPSLHHMHPPHASLKGVTSIKIIWRKWASQTSCQLEITASLGCKSKRLQELHSL